MLTPSHKPNPTPYTNDQAAVNSTEAEIDMNTASASAGCKPREPREMPVLMADVGAMGACKAVFDRCPMRSLSIERTGKFVDEIYTLTAKVDTSIFGQVRP